MKIFLACAALTLAAAGANAAAKQTLDNPNATPEAVAVYDYLLSLTQSTAAEGKLIAGHWAGGSFRPGVSDYPFNMGEINEIRRQSGKWVGMLDGWICCGEFGMKMQKESPGVKPADRVLNDCMWYGQMVADYRLWWLNGGICHVDASFYAPHENGFRQRFEKDKVPVEVNYANILKPGTGENRQWMALCDRMAEFFLALQKENVPVIFRPFTEAYIPLFWYSEKRMGAEMCIKMWRYLHDYLTLTKGCNNIIWDFQGDRTFAHYPGDAYVDILTTRSEYRANLKSEFQCVASGSGMPVGNGELGDYGNNPKVAPERQLSWSSRIEKYKTDCPGLSFYITWDRNWGPTQAQDKQTGAYPGYDPGYNEVMNNPYIVTRERIACTPKAPALPYRNDFKTSELPIIFGGNWSAGGGALKRSDAVQAGMAIMGGTDWDNYTATAQLVASGSGECGLAGRCTSGDIFYAATFADGNLTLWKCFTDKRTELGKTPFRVSKGDLVAIELIFKGNAISAKASAGKTVATLAAADSAIPVGCVAVYSKNSAVECRGISVKK